VSRTRKDRDKKNPGSVKGTGPWRKEGNRPYRRSIRELMVADRYAEIPISFGAHCKRDRRGYYW